MKSGIDIGISVIICCYNSSNRIGDTLLALSLQKFNKKIPWELIVVDNASTDSTADLVIEYWRSMAAHIPLNIVSEPRAGLANARRRGILSASYAYLVFCDDDNHLDQGYLQKMFNNLHNNPKVGACGGRGIPFFETGCPKWFNEYAEAFAVGAQQSEKGERIVNLYGAGIGMKKEVLKEIDRCGYIPVMSGRKGKKLSSADDTELTYALVILGYQLMYDDELLFFHFLPKERLQWSYLEKLMKSFGSDGPVRNLYYSYISQNKIHQQLRNWYIHLGLCLVRFVKYLIVPPKKNARRIYFDWNIAYLKALFKLKPLYPALKENIEKLDPENINKLRHSSYALRVRASN